MTSRLEQRFEQGMMVRELAGPGRSRGPLVWIHGLGESGLCFESIMGHERLARWRHLAPDMPGYGKSPWTVPPYRLERMVEHLAAWLEQRTAAPVTLIGHSMGGVLGLRICERQPQRVARFINVEGNVTREDCTFSKPAAALSLEAFERNGFARLREEVYRAGNDEVAQRGYHASLLLCDPRLFHLNSQELVTFSTRPDVADRLAALSMPVTFVAGVPRGLSARSRACLQATRIETIAIEDSGHWPFIDQPDRFAVALARALDG